MTDKNISTEYTGVYTGIFPNVTPKEIELEARVKELEKRLKIAEKALQYYANSTLGEEYEKGKSRYPICTNSVTGDIQYIEYDATKAQQALQQMEDIDGTR